MKNNNGLIVIIVLMAICMLGLGGYIVYDKVFAKEVDVEIVKDNNDDNNKNKVMTDQEALKIAKDIYEKSYAQIADGMNILVHDYVNEKYNIDDVIAQKYFTDDYVKLLKKEAEEQKDIYLETLFISSIFGATDQSKRELELVSFGEDTIVVKGHNDCRECLKDDYCSCWESTFPHYIVLKKVNSNWLIDYFN